MRTRYLRAGLTLAAGVTACMACDGEPLRESEADLEDRALALSQNRGAAGTESGVDKTWPTAGHDLSNTRYQAAERKIGTANVASLQVAWAFTTGGDVSATPAVDGSTVYVPDWSGQLYALDRTTGAPRWSRPISAYTGVEGDFARATPAINKDRLILGDQKGNGARVFAVNKNTGAPIWTTLVEPDPSAIITQSAVVGDSDVIYVGVSSTEEVQAGTVPGYACCSFRGSLVALDAKTGAIRWKTYMAPLGYSGNAVWGSTPVFDRARKTVYVTTGNNYNVPEAVRACVAAAQTDAARRACQAADNFFDAVLALDATTGAIKWATQTLAYDAWTFGCVPGFNPEGCPDPAGPGLDFAQGPALFTAPQPGGGKRQLLGAGQKSGKYWALDPVTGAVVWVTQTGPGGYSGGLLWGSSVDGTRIYTANATSNVWSALDVATGEVLWNTATPGGGSASAPTSVANGVVYSCLLDAAGTMVAMNAVTGQILWSFPSGGSCLSGAAISDGFVYWGSGYGNRNLGTPNNKLYAFTVTP